MTAEDVDEFAAELRDACAYWQSGRNASSLVRAAARVISDVPHYFASEFIERYEEDARNDPAALRRARVLLEAVARSPARAPAEWRRASGLPSGDFAGRGLGPKPENAQVVETLRSGEITMPLWGVSLDREVAETYGTSILFILEAPFHGVAAWRYSGVKDAEQELITGGRYEVLDISPDGPYDSRASLVVRVREVEPLSSPQIGSRSERVGRGWA